MTKKLALFFIGFGLFVQTNAQEQVVWIGTTTPSNGPSKGIYRCVFDASKGRLSTPVLAAKISSPGFLTLNQSGTRLYSVGRIGDESCVAAFEVMDEAPYLWRLNSQPIGDGGSAHVSLDRDDRLLFTAQYGGGSVAVYPIDEKGYIQSQTQLVKHTGSGPNPARQKSPHPHWTGVSQSNAYLYVPDLGLDRVVYYEIDHANAAIRSKGMGICPPGGGPRHMKFHPSNRWAYVLNELQLSVTTFNYNAESGSLHPIQTLSALPENLREGFNSGSEIRIHPNGRFLYTANRGHDSITVFEIDTTSGLLTFKEREPVRGSWPRNFNIDPTGKWLIAAGRNSNTLSVFEIDSREGLLLYTQHTVNCPTPICVAFQ